MTNTNPADDPALDITPELDPCGCCDGLTLRTPLLIENRAGLSTIAYRAGTHGTFLQTLLTRLATSGYPALRDLTTRDTGDFTVGLLDAWATVGDVITFYQERIANESYLRTATERVSLIYLARLIGYKLRPGLAAETILTFTMEDAPGAPVRATIPVGAQVQSVPEQGQQPQTFETIEAIEARPAWNTLHPRRSQRFALNIPRAAAMPATFILEGLTANLKPGDILLYPIEGSGTTFGVVLSVTQVLTPPPGASTNPMQMPSSKPEPPKNVTLVQVRLPDPSKGTAPQGNDVIKALSNDQTPPPTLSAFAQLVVAGFPTKRVKAADLEAQATIGGWQVQDLFDTINSTAKLAPRVWALKTRAAIFGHNAPSFSSLPAALTDYQLSFNSNGTAIGVKGPYNGKSDQWVDSRNLNNYPDPDSVLTGDSDSVRVPLDTIYSGPQSGSYILFRDGLNWGIFAIKRTSEQSISLFTLTGKSSVLNVSPKSPNLAHFGIRTTTAYGEPAPLTLARQPITALVADMNLDLEGLVQGLTVGQRIVVTGELDGQRGVVVSEAAQLAQVEYDFNDEPYTLLTLTQALTNTFVRETVTINANAARATHGESKAEILGSGDSGQAFQRFSLKQPPLTTISSQSTEGSQSTLEVRVNGLLWNEMPYLYGHGPGERIYITRQEEDGSTTVQFGDGQSGARPPTGRENIRADYRKGAGVAGLLKQEQISLLMTRPQGVRSASNRLPSTGGQDPDSIDQIRQNATLPILTLDRIVSLQDYQDFANAFSGIAKSLATWSWDGRTRGMFITVAGPGGTTINDDSTVRKNLLAAMRASGDPYVHLQVKSYRPAFFRLVARVKFLPEVKGRESDLQAAIIARLRAAFSFSARAFGQPVQASEIIAMIQGTPGVMAVTLDKLHRSNKLVAYNARLDASAPAAGAAMNIQAAELLTLDPAIPDVSVMP